MDNKKKIDFHTDNLAVPEVTVNEDPNSAPEASEPEEDMVVYENLAFPEIHIKPASEKKDGIN